MVECLYFRRSENRNRTDFYGVMLLMHIIIIETFWQTKTRYSLKIFMNVLLFSNKKRYIKTSYSPKMFMNFDNFFLSDFWDKYPKIYTKKYLKQFSTENYTWRIDLVQNILISCKLLISLDQNVSILFVNNIYSKY